MGAMATYVRAGLPEVATALAALTGEPHPLAIKDPGTGPPANTGIDPGSPCSQNRLRRPAPASFPAATIGVIGMILWSGTNDQRRRQFVTGQPGVASIRRPACLPVAADQRLGLLPLPRPRRHRILSVLGRDPPVEHEPNHAAPGRTPVPAGGPLRPRHQGAPASPRLGVRGKRRGHHPSASPAPQEYPATPASPAEPVKTRRHATPEPARPRRESMG